MVSRSAMRLLAHRLLPGLLGLALWACEDDPAGPACLRDCTTCTADACPTTRCGLQVVMSEDCLGVSGGAEVAVDQCVQDETLAPGYSARLCVAIPLHESRRVVIRSEERVWEGTVECSTDKGGRTLVLTASCGDGDEADVSGEGETE